MSSMFPNLSTRSRRSAADDGAQPSQAPPPANVPSSSPSPPPLVSQGLRPTTSRHRFPSEGFPSQTLVTGFTREQLDAKFALEQRKMEAKLAAIEAKKRFESDESQARIAAIQSAAATAVVPPTQADEGEESIGEIPPAALLVASHFPGLPRAEISRIFSNKFRPENLYKLRHLKGREDKDQEENVTIEQGVMKIKRATGTLRDFGSSLDIWSEAFINYAMIMGDFFGAAFPSLGRVLLIFHQKIRTLSKIYDWQGAVLPLAIDFHTEVITDNHTNVEAWSLPQTWIDQYCSPQHVLSTSSGKKRAATTQAEGSASKKAKEICRNFNSKGCTFKECSREHKCSECSSLEHGAQTCPTKSKQ